MPAQSPLELPSNGDNSAAAQQTPNLLPLPVLANATNTPLLAKDEQLDDTGLQSVPVLATRKRVEITGVGKFWQWRWSESGQRKSAYGGKFRDLSEERKAQYYANKESKSRNR